MSTPTLVLTRPMRMFFASRRSSSLTRSPYSVPGTIRLTVADGALFERFRPRDGEIAELGAAQFAPHCRADLHIYLGNGIGTERGVARHPARAVVAIRVRRTERRRADDDRELGHRRADRAVVERRRVRIEAPLNDEAVARPGGHVERNRMRRLALPAV